MANIEKFISTHIKGNSKFMSDVIAKYINVVEKTIDISAEEEPSLIAEAKAGNVKAKEKLFCSYLKLVLGVAKKYNIQNIAFTDLVQEGVLGLEDALERFDAARGNRFSTMAKWWVRARILHYIRNNIRMFDIPTGTSSRIFAINKSIEKLGKELNHSPTNKEIGEDLSLAEVKVAFLRKFLNPTVSINDTVSIVDGESSVDIQDLLMDDRNDGREALIRDDGVRKIKEAMKTLPDVQRHILKMRYALKGGEELTLKQTSDLMYRMGYTPKRLTQERIRQIQNQAEARLKFLISK